MKRVAQKLKAQYICYQQKETTTKTRKMKTTRKDALQLLKSYYRASEKKIKLLADGIPNAKLGELTYEVNSCTTMMKIYSDALEGFDLEGFNL